MYVRCNLAIASNSVHSTWTSADKAAKGCRALCEVHRYSYGPGDYREKAIALANLSGTRPSALHFLQQEKNKGSVSERDAKCFALVTEPASDNVMIQFLLVYSEPKF